MKTQFSQASVPPFIQKPVKRICLVPLICSADCPPYIHQVKSKNTITEKPNCFSQKLKNLKTEFKSSCA